MTYVNEIPTRKTFETLGSAYTYEQVVNAIETANALNAEYEAAQEDVERRMYATFSTDDFTLMSDDERRINGEFWGLVNSSLDGINCNGRIGQGSREFWPVARIEADIKRLRTQIKRLQKFGKAF